MQRKLFDAAERHMLDVVARSNPPFRCDSYSVPPLLKQFFEKVSEKDGIFFFTNQTPGYSSRLAKHASRSEQSMLLTSCVGRECARSVVRAFCGVRNLVTFGVGSPPFSL